MSYSVIPTPRFKKDSKRLIKKYRSLPTDLLKFEEDLSKNPRLGTSLGGNTYKVRLAITSKGKGKSGGARIITYLVTADQEIYLLTIWDKSKIADIDSKTLKQLVKEIKEQKGIR